MNMIAGIFLIICSILVMVSVVKLLGIKAEEKMSIKQSTIFVIVNVTWGTFAIILFFYHREAVEDFIIWALAFILTVSKFMK